ncbi:thymidine kinase [Bodo saltans virus]|uniref:Thymidine kinase n=1 Tax=Bodo saltans virus TaxID=2024608 RepID=A0A2H4UTS3_9VIRU|nr:thymidine kinase [Bodo saltans virus]ATZ80288.1 thymidine kinase [Bodo saltans virus]
MSSSNVGTLKIILGCMYSGKTSALIAEYHKWESINKKPLCINFTGDNRYGNICENNMYNHNKSSVKCVYTSNLLYVEEHIIDSVDVILINEGQFFPDLYDAVKYWCDVKQKNIIVSGLDGDYKRNEFGQMLKIIPLSNHVEKLNAFCAKCADGTLAQFTHRISKEKDLILIGGHGDYVALCRNCYFNGNKE